MLQQILQDMYVDPELLCQLKDEQRRTLFSKMREEQVRRYNEWQLAESKKFLKPRLPPKPGKKRVRFVLGDDGEPIATVVGDADEELSYSSEDEPAMGIESRFLEILRKTSVPDCDKRAKIAEEDEGDEEVRVTLLRSEMFIRDMEQREEKEKKDWLAKKQQQLKARQDTLQKLTDGLSRTSLQKEDSIKSAKETIGDTAANNDNIQTDVAKAWEQKKIKDLALKAMDFHKRLQENQNEGSEVVTGNNKYNSAKRQLSIPVSRTKSRPDKPPSRPAIIEWFRNSESHRVSVTDPTTGHVAEWFHGMISRMDAEKVLLLEPAGTYLVRMSERIWGYAISYRTPDRCKHFLIDATTNYYQFFGDENAHHASLADLVQYHRVHPITESGQEYLLKPCPQPRLRLHLWELLDS